MKKTRLSLAVILFLAFLLSLNFTACDMFDDDDDDNDDVVDITDDNLVGTWYRYSKTVNDTNRFTKSRMILDANGTGVENCEYPGEGTHLDQRLRVFDWNTEDGVLSIVERESNEILFDGVYILGSGIGFLRLTDEYGLEDVYVREMDIHDDNILGDWTGNSFEIEGLPMSGTWDDCEYLSDGTIVWGDTSSIMNWFVNSSYLVWIEPENPDYSQTVWSYNIITSDDTPDTLFLEGTVLIYIGEDEGFWTARKCYSSFIRNE